MTPAEARHRRRSGRHSAAVIAGLAVVVVAVIVATVLATLDGLGTDDARTGEERPPVRIGYVPYWDQARGFDVVREHPDLFDQVSPVWYSLEPTGQVVLTDAENTTVDLETVRVLQDDGILVIPTVTNLRDGDWDPDTVQAMLHSPDAVQTHIRELVALAVDQGYDGIDIDYEHLRASDREPYSEFLAGLGTALREESKLLTTAVHPKTSEAGYGERNKAQDFRAIGAAADQVRVMTYDYSWESSPPGPVAPADWVEEVIAWTVTQIPSHKVILGIVLLGYDWVDEQGETVDFSQAQARAESNDTIVQRAEDGSPTFTYQDSSGRQREVWFEDATSVGSKLPIVDEYELGGAFFWRLGGEDPHVWPVVRGALP